MSWRVGARTDVGLQRDNNEDSFFAGTRLLVVADGVGGSAAGEIASSLAVNALQPLESDQAISDPLRALRDATRTANTDLREAIEADPTLSGMGTTLTALLWADGTLAVAQLGDSRAYRLRAGRLEQITHDHTLVQSLVDEGQITTEEAAVHPRRSWILRALDGREDSDPDVETLDPHGGDRYLLCSDGLSDYVEEPAIATALGGGDPQDASERLVQLALQAGAPDNVTCIVADPVEDAVAQPPLIGGAAANQRNRKGAAAPSNEPEPAPAPEAKRVSIGKRLTLVVGVIVILVAAAIVATVVYINHQWYVASSNGNVAIYQGVKGSAVGHKLSHVHSISKLPVSAVLPYERQDVINGSNSYNSQSAAQAYVDRLTSDACAQAAKATPRPSPTPHATSSAKARRTHRTRPRPTPTPTLPAYCPAGS
jgi:protein phosphatase